MQTISDEASVVAAPDDDADLDIPELDDAFFKNAVVGKHYERVMRNANVVRIAPDVHDAFPNEAAVNDALRTLVQLRRLVLTTTADALAQQRQTA